VNSRSSFQGLLLELTGSSLVQAPIKNFSVFPVFLQGSFSRIQPEGHLFWKESTTGTEVMAISVTVEEFPSHT
jgi:hypothetical protein